VTVQAVRTACYTYVCTCIHLEDRQEERQHVRRCGVAVLA